MCYTDEVRKFVSDNFLFGDEGSLQNEQSFLESGIIDSTGMLELIMFLESSYGINVDSEEMLPENLDNVNRVVAFIERKRAEVATAKS